VNDFKVFRWTGAFWVGLRDLVPVASGNACMGNLKRRLGGTDTCILPLPSRLGRAPTFLVPIITPLLLTTAISQLSPSVPKNIERNRKTHQNIEKYRNPGGPENAAFTGEIVYFLRFRFDCGRLTHGRSHRPKSCNAHRPLPETLTFFGPH
jgi:hypothetical protein